MEPVNLEPRYSSHETTGRCLRCLAQEYLNNCIVEMIGSGEDNDLLQHKYNALVTFLQSPDIQNLIDETERCLSEGKKVNVKLNYADDKLSYDIKIE